MALSLAQLLTPKTEAEALADILAILDGFGFAASSWQEGSIQRHLVQVMARFTASASNTTLAITKGRFNDTAEGDWLTLKSASDFDNTRSPATTTRVKMTLTDPLGVGPSTIVLSQLVATDQAGRTYRNVEAGTLAINGSLTLAFEAEVPGSAAQPTSLVLATPIAGIEAAIASSNALVRLGANAEADDRLRVRNRNKWAALAYAAPAEAYVTWALEASDDVTRAWVDDLNPRGPGTLDIYVAGSSGTLLPSPVLLDVFKYITGVSAPVGKVQRDRRPLGSDIGTILSPAVFNATLQTISVTGTLYVGAAYDRTTVRQAVYDAITAYMRALPVGGTVKIADLYRVAMAVQGVSNIHITAPVDINNIPTDVVVAQTSIPVPAMNLTAVVG